MDKQYSVKFFTCLVESMQKVCRDLLDFEQVIDFSGYLCVEIDNYRKERYVISELVHRTGHVISESYCTKAFKTSRKSPRQNSGGAENTEPRQNALTGTCSVARSVGTGRRSPWRSELSGSREGASSNHTESSWAVSAESEYEMCALGRKRTISQSNMPVIKQDRSEDYGDSPEIEELSAVDSQSTSNTYLTKPGCGSSVCTQTGVDNKMSTFNTPPSSSTTINFTTQSSSSSTNSNTPQTSHTSESIRLPLNINIKEEDDVPFMVLEHSTDSVAYGDNDSSSMFGQSQTMSNETLSLSASNFGEQEHVQVSAEPSTLSFLDRLPEDPQIRQSLTSNKIQTIRSKNLSFQCKKCHQMLKDSSQLKRHMRMYHPEKHTCNICGKTFDYRQSLWEHKLNHSGKKKFLCPYSDCGKTFARQSHLTDHVNWHTGSKPYTCNMCHKQFRGKYTLSRHAKFCVHAQLG